MARNKYPEETVEKILDVSYRLFTEKGYERTTIQDIVDALGMSKGAIYHHFKSKEDILDQITTRYYDQMDWFSHIRADESLTGLEKLQQILEAMLSDREKVALDHMAMSMELDPRMLALVVTSTFQETCPFTLALVEEGIRDGSITAQYPRELNEVLMLLLNVWVGVFAHDHGDFMRKITFLKEMTDRMGMPLINDHLLAVADAYFRNITLEVRKRGWGPESLERREKR